MAGASPTPAPGGAPTTAPAAGGPLAEFRQRLVAELALSAAQQQQVDAIFAATRPEFGKLRELPEDQRPKARERVLADIRAKVADVLTPEQRPKYANLVAESAGRQTTRGRVFVPGADGQPVAHDVRLGLTDGSSTELIVPPGSAQAGVFTAGATVIVGQPAAGAAPGKPAGGPRLPF